jgi:hypothetical protein
VLLMAAGIDLAQLERLIDDGAQLVEVLPALDTPVADIRAALAASSYGFALVLGTGRILLGRVRRSALASTKCLLESRGRHGARTEHRSPRHAR